MTLQRVTGQCLLRQGFTVKSELFPDLLVWRRLAFKHNDPDIMKLEEAQWLFPASSSFPHKQKPLSAHTCFCLTTSSELSRTLTPKHWQITATISIPGPGPSKRWYPIYVWKLLRTHCPIINNNNSWRCYSVFSFQKVFSFGLRIFFKWIRTGFYPHTMIMRNCCFRQNLCCWIFKGLTFFKRIKIFCSIELVEWYARIKTNCFQQPHLNYFIVM